MSSLTVEDIDAALTEVSRGRFLAEEELPEWVDLKNIRHITETTHAGSLVGRDGSQVRFYDASQIVDSLLDMRALVTD